MIHEIKQVIWLDTPKGQALAKFIVDRGVDSDLEWITVLQDTGQVLSFDSSGKPFWSARASRLAGGQTGQSSIMARNPSGLAKALPIQWADN